MEINYNCFERLLQENNILRNLAAVEFICQIITFICILSKKLIDGNSTGIIFNYLKIKKLKLKQN